MSILVDRDILAAMERGSIIITPFDRKCLGTNSYDVHLASTLRVYKSVRDLVSIPGDTISVASGAARHRGIHYVQVINDQVVAEFSRDEIIEDERKFHEVVDHPLDTRSSRETYDLAIGSEGFVLEPGELYLASTVEHTESKEHVPMLNGRSSTGRLGLSIHVTAGTGDIGFRGPWTMELTVVKRLRVHAGDAIGQLLWFYPSGPPLTSYDQKPSAKYNDAGPLPQPSKLHEERS